jgi:hypothetical protein
MSLTVLDTKLKILAKSLGGELTKDDAKGMIVPTGFEERSISWIKNDLDFLIQIYPEIINNNIRKWILWTCCSYDTDKSRFLKKATILDSRKQFEIIANFDNLIEEALHFLNGLTKDDLEKVLDFDDD